MIIVILGNAGSGKTTLARALSEYLEDSVFVNLDPANPVNCQVDIREYVKAEDIMKKYKLGPNSSIIKSVELSLNYIDLIAEKIKDFYWKIIDTPGQLELFLHKDIGKRILDRLEKLDEIAPIFLIDIQDVLDPRNFLASIAWNVIIYLKLQRKVPTVINKIDIISQSTLENLREKIQKFEFFKELEGGDNLDYLISKNFREFYEYSTVYRRPIFISAKEGKGFDDLISALLDMFCTCGDIT